jgi:hypothetical protein
MLESTTTIFLKYVFSVFVVITILIANTARVVINENNADLHIKYTEFKDGKD